MISHVHAHGDRRPYVSALIAPSPTETLSFGTKRGLVSEETAEKLTAELMANPYSRSDSLNETMATIVSHDEFRKRIRRAVELGNEKLARVERVRRFSILDRDLSPDEGELTPTMKVKRRVMEDKYSDLIDQIYADEDFALEPHS